MEDQHFGNVEDAADGVAEGGNVALPGELGPLKFLQQSTNHFDTGSGVPAVAVNDAGVVLSVHSSNRKYYYDRGQITDPSAGVVWHGSSKEYGSGDGDPCIAINDQNDVVALSWDESKSEVYWSAGSYDPSSAEITWFSQNQTLGSGTSSPAVAMNDAGVIVAAFIQNGVVYGQVGAMGRAGDTIDWSPAAPVNLPPPVAQCSVTINDNNDILLSVVTNGSTFTTYGALASGATSIQWNNLSVPLSSALNSSIALDDNGLAIETTSLDGLPSYSRGKLVPDVYGNKTVKWAHPGWSVPNLAAQVQSVTFAVNGSYLVVLWQDDDKYYSGVAVAW
jgi:hypothetical protein